MHFDCDPSPAFVFPGDAKRTDQQRISARPFVFVDENMRPYVLTRLKIVITERGSTLGFARSKCGHHEGHT